MKRTCWHLRNGVVGAPLLLFTAAAIAQDIVTTEKPNYVASVERQPLEASINRVAQALQIAGSPLNGDVLQQINELSLNNDDVIVVRELQRLLDPLCLMEVSINPESRVKVAAGQAIPTLDQRGWTNF